MILEFTCFLYDKKLADLDIKVPDIEALCSIDTKEIEAVRQCVSEDGSDKIDKTTCYVYLKSGTSWQIKNSYKHTIELWEKQ